MPAFGDTLSDAEIRAVLAYLKSLWPPAEREAQWLASQNDPLPALQSE
jgi:mono/diheme cytochrome c family protein